MWENRGKTHKLTDFIPQTIIVACRCITFIILYNKSFHPMVLGGEIVKQNTK